LRCSGQIYYEQVVGDGTKLLWQYINISCASI